MPNKRSNAKGSRQFRIQTCHRSAVTGRFVTAAEAAKDPACTVRTRIKHAAKGLRQICAKRS